jgi:hypothetical protein
MKLAFLAVGTVMGASVVFGVAMAVYNLNAAWLWFCVPIVFILV